MAKAKSVLVVGGSGFLGYHIASQLRKNYKVYATFYSRRMPLEGVTWLPSNVKDRDWMRRLAFLAEPSAVIYVAGTNKIDFVEKNARDSELVQSEGPANLSGVTDLLGAKFLYVSSSYAFDGHRGNYHEADTLVPGSMLGKVKASGEGFIRSKCLNYIILRSVPLLGRGNLRHFSFLDQLRMALAQNRKIELSPYEMHSYAPVSGFVELIENIIASGFKKRIFHYGGLTKITPVELAKRFAERFGYNPALIHPRTVTLQGGMAPPVQDFSLNFTSAVNTFKLKPHSIEETFDILERETRQSL